MSIVISIRFYEELNDFLPPAQRKTSVSHHVKQTRSIKDLIESLGIPHTEVDMILVNGESVDFGYLIQNGDRISVYPMFESLDISSIIQLRPNPLRTTRFVLDVHLGRLARYLRMLGFDTLYRNDYDDQTLANISNTQQRILLTCDKRLLMRKQVTHGYYVRERDSRKQLGEILIRFDLFNDLRVFNRCMSCNGIIKKVQKPHIVHILKPDTRKRYQEFWQCANCCKVFWKGSHYEHMLQFIAAIKKHLTDTENIA